MRTLLFSLSIHPPAHSRRDDRRRAPGRDGLTACLEAAGRAPIQSAWAHGSVPGTSAGYLFAGSRQLIRLMPWG